jgi:hypothetical protein
MARQPLRSLLALLLAALLLLTATCSAAALTTRLPAAAGRRVLLADAAASSAGGTITANAGATAIHSAVEEVEVVKAVAQQQAYDVAFCRDQRNRAGMSGLFVGGALLCDRRCGCSLFPFLPTVVCAPHPRCLSSLCTRRTALMGGCAVYCLVAARHSVGGHGHGAVVGDGQAAALDADDLKQRLTRLKALQAATSA